MSAAYWTGLAIVNQVAGELGLPQTATLAGTTNVQANQLLALLNSAGNELLLYYPWEQLHQEWVFDTVLDTGEYPLPDDWSYAVDQTQWDRTNHWPLLGPKSPQEWAWLKGGLLATAPRIRYRIQNNKFLIWPIPQLGTTPDVFHLALEYVSKYWVSEANSEVPNADFIVNDSDIVWYNPWLAVKYVKLLGGDA